MGNGYPIAAIIGKSNVMESAQKTFISSTYWTDRIGPTAALATIKKHKDLNVAEHLIAIGDKVQKEWIVLGQKHGLAIEVGGMKPASHFVFLDDQVQEMKAYYVQLMMEQGILASDTHLHISLLPRTQASC